MNLIKIKLKALFPLIIFIIIAIFLWQGLNRNPHKIPSPFINKPLPKFSAVSLEAPDKLITNADLKGHVSLLNVFATWCLSCRAEHPVLMDIKDEYNVKIYGLNYKDQRQAALKWLARYGDPYVKVIYDPRGKVGINLGVYGTPETFVVDRNGIIRYKYIGPISPDAWKNKLLPVVVKLEKKR